MFDLRVRRTLALLAVSACSACGSNTGCHGIAGQEALDLALSIQSQSRENPAYAHEGVPIAELRPDRILVDRTYPKGSGLSATSILFVHPRTGRRLRYLEIFEDCDPEWRVYGGRNSVNGVPVDDWENAIPVSSLR